jgi:NhaP-type Na+/H+ or K+/H+ antiporter
MSTTPPEQGRGPDVPLGRTLGSPGSIARLPMPGNAEFAAYVVINIFLAILLFDDAWNVNDWAFANVVLGSAYLLSRGIAKASRVLEA